MLSNGPNKKRTGKTHKGKRPVFPSVIGLGESLTITSWFKQKEQNVVLADFVRFPRSGGL
jgi:hypothetical protein